MKTAACLIYLKIKCSLTVRTFSSNKDLRGLLEFSVHIIHTLLYLQRTYLHIQFLHLIFSLYFLYNYIRFQISNNNSLLLLGFPLQPPNDWLMLSRWNGECVCGYGLKNNKVSLNYKTEDRAISTQMLCSFHRVLFVYFCLVVTRVEVLKSFKLPLRSLHVLIR